MLSLIIVNIAVAKLLHLTLCIQFLEMVFSKETSGLDRMTVSGYVFIRILAQPMVSLLSLFLVDRLRDANIIVAVQLHRCRSFLL